MPAKRRVQQKMEDYLNKHDNVKVEVEELELIMSEEDSEVNLRCISMNASRTSRQFSRSSVQKKEGST